MRGFDCPTWCVSNHASEEGFFLEDNQVGELLHATDPAPIPVVVLLHNAQGARMMAADNLDVVLFQHQFLGASMAETQEEWVFMGSDHGGLTVTRESAMRVYRLLGTVLAAGT